MSQFTFCFLAALFCTTPLLAEETVVLRVTPTTWNAIQLPDGRCIRIGSSIGTPEPTTITLQEDKDGNLAGTWESNVNIGQKASFSIEILRQQASDRDFVTSRIKNKDGLTISTNLFTHEKNTMSSFPALEMESPLEYASHGCNPSASLKITPIEK